MGNMSEKKKTSETVVDTKKAAAKADAKPAKKAEASSKSKAKTSDKSKKKPNPVVKYFKDLRSEFKKVVWPSRKTVVNNTGVVLICMCVSGLFVAGVDLAFTALLNLMLSKA